MKLQTIIKTILMISLMHLSTIHTKKTFSVRHKQVPLLTDMTMKLFWINN
jgi:hypothetical protein